MTRNRPYMQSGVADLEKLVEDKRESRGALQSILAELDHRETDRAKKLRGKVTSILDGLELALQPSSGNKAAKGEPHLPGISAPLLNHSARDEKSKTAPAGSEIKSDNEMSKKESGSRDDLASATKADAEQVLDPQVSEWTQVAVAKLRAKLIDLSRRSPLISFKHSTRSASQLRFVDERIDLLFERLNRGSMGFEPLPGEEQTPADERTPKFGIAYEHARLTDIEFLAATESLGDSETDVRIWQDAERSLRGRVRQLLGLPKLEYGKTLDVKALARAHGFDPSFDLKTSDEGDFAEHEEDDNIRVLLVRKELDRRLKTIKARATSHLRETGHHTLHLAFGFVQWFEDDVSDLAFCAPLLLLPVQLTKDQGRAKNDYRLSKWEGELEVNVSLVEKARDHWGLELPTLREGETPESYFIRAEAVLAKGRRLTLRTFVTLSILPPMILWRDLDPEKWAADAFAEHRLLPGLVGAAEISGVEGDDSVIDIDDPELAPRIPALITDADASQHRAIIDMASGRDMAIEGPPGTGKSQTITNMIATALSQGKRVLFVAEKQAALRVVSDRLRASGFGPLLLELHGDRASRSDVYAGLSERLAARPQADARELEEKRTELRRHRNTLRRYLALVHTSLGKLGKTAHALVWREVRLRELCDVDQIRALEARWPTSNIADLDAPTLSENRELLTQYGKALRAIEEQRPGSCTSWVPAEKLDPFDQGAALDAAADAAHSASPLADLANKLSALRVELPPPSDNDFSTCAAQLSAVRPLSCSDEAIVASAICHKAACLALQDAQSEWVLQRDELNDAIDHPESVPIEAALALLDALSVDSCPPTLAEATASKATLQRNLTEWEKAGRDVERLTQRLSDDHRATIAKSCAIAKILSELGEAKPCVSALLSNKLLDAASDSVIAASRHEAAALLHEDEELRVQIQVEAFSCEPIELEDTAEILEATGVFARLFSGRYKTANRRASRLCVDQSDRLQIASTLRRTAAFLRARRAFHEDGKAKGLFPALLWEGFGSDFDSLHAARALISQSSAKLAALDEIGLLRWWLDLDEAERKTLCATGDRLAGILLELSDAGYSETTLEAIADSLAARIHELGSIAKCSEVIGIRPHAPFFQSGGETVADAILKLHQARRSFDDVKSRPEFGWVTEVEESLDVLAKCLDELEGLHSIAPAINFADLLRETTAPASLLTSITEVASTLSPSVEEWEKASERLRNLTGLKTAVLCDGLDWRQSTKALTELSSDGSGASLVADLLKYRASLAARQLVPFADAAASSEASPSQLDDIYELLAISSLTRSYLGGDGQELGRLGSLSLDAARRSFKKIDKALHKLEAAAIVAGRLQDRPPIGVGHGRKSDYTELRLLEHEVELKRPRTPLRDVAHRAGEALQALKPVWMMSPTSIAQFIRPGTLEFHLLIIDEASQMRPEHSVSCILRADQFVVVGDANQLPPSDHFQVAGIDDDDDDADGVGVDDSTESILDLANQRFRTKPRLKWHYRSQHESLIQFSNRQFYERDLVIFPSPMANDDALLGVKCIYAPSVYPDTVYEASINQREAELVIEQAFALMQTYPERSIGIVAMNAKQTELIQNEFDRLAVEEERVGEYIDSFAGTLDEFFIKNLENVQGDERDIILISTVYGPDKNGAVRQNFGLMNREVGWRRLNVLVTRAKMSCRLITSLRPDDVKVTDKSSKGVISFKSYLTYAHGGAHYEEASSGETDSDFEIFVADALRDAGYEVVYQVGVENFRIDLGVRHESCPVGFIAGIECDGAPYHSGLSVRDRDHIRQTILENLGWNIYRVWSTDWFNDPARETAKLLAWLDGVKENTVRNLAAQSSQLKVRKPKKRPKPASTDDESDGPANERTEKSTTHSKSIPEILETPLPREPKGRELRSLGDFQTYEAVRGRLYEVWKEPSLLGEVEVIRRAEVAPRLYGDRLGMELSEYEGRVEDTGDSFRSTDIYAAIREVARRALSRD